MRKRKKKKKKKKDKQFHDDVIALRVLKGIDELDDVWMVTILQDIDFHVHTLSLTLAEGVLVDDLDGARLFGFFVVAFMHHRKLTAAKTLINKQATKRKNSIQATHYPTASSIE